MKFKNIVPKQARPIVLMGLHGLFVEGVLIHRNGKEQDISFIFLMNKRVNKILFSHTLRHPLDSPDRKMAIAVCRKRLGPMHSTNFPMADFFQHCIKDTKGFLDDFSTPVNSAVLDSILQGFSYSFEKTNHFAESIIGEIKGEDMFAVAEAFCEFLTGRLPKIPHRVKRNDSLVSGMIQVPDFENGIPPSVSMI